MIGSLIAEAWLYETISELTDVIALGTDKVWKRKAPPEVEAPFVVFTRISSSDHGGIGGPVTSSTLQYQWAVIDEGLDDTTIEDAAAAIDAATDGVSVTYSGHQVTSNRVQEIPTDDPTEEGKDAVWIGGTVEIFVCAA